MGSYRTQFQDLKLLLRQHIPACICLQETLIANRHINAPSGYTIVCSQPVRQDGHERGTALLIHNRVAYDIIHLNTELQAVAATLHLQKSYTICSLYLPHVPVTTRALEQLLDQLPSPYLLLGDMNAKSPLWGDAITDHRGRIFEDLLHDQNICLLNDHSPTHYHVQTNSYSVIDLSICSADCFIDFDYSVLPHLNGSDHYPIAITLREPAVLADTPDRYNIARANWTRFKDLTETHLSATALPDIDELITAVTNVITTAATIAIPLKTGITGRPTVPWFTEACKNARRNRLRAERAHKRHGTMETKIAYQRAKAICRHTFRQAQKESWRSYISRINSRLPPSKLWKRVSKISGKFTSSPTPVIQGPQGDVISDHRAVANLLAQHFSSVTGDHTYSPEFLRHKLRTEARPLSFYAPGSSDLLYNSPFTLRELQSVLSTAQESAPGNDKVTYSLLKHVHPSMITLILATFNRIFQEQVFPTSWHNAIVIPIAKPGKDPRLSGNYRPISLTNCLCKLLEKMSNIRLMWHLESQHFISPAQSGFRKNRSTTDNLIQLDHDIRLSMKHHLHTVAIFFDIQKAYDTAWRRGVLQTLHNFGLRGNLPAFIQNFLSDRCIQVRIGKLVSDPQILNEGIPQGSVLSCTCFLLAINTITSVLPEYVKANIYVDDFMIYTSSSLLPTIERRLQLALNRLSRWSHETGFTFSSEKTVSMHICKVRNCPHMDPNLTLYERPIRNVETYKYLGMIVDNQFTWKHHISHIRTTSQSTLNLLKHISSKRWGADRKSLIRLYIMLLKPKIDYGSEIYSSAPKSYLDRLNPIHNTAIRIATGAFRSSPVMSMYAESGLKPLSSFRDIKLLNMYTRIIVNPEHPLYDTVTLLEADADVALEEERQIASNGSFFHRTLIIKQAHELSFQNIINEIPSILPLWTVNNLTFCAALYDIRKDTIRSTAFRRIFERHLLSHRDSSCIFTDGSKDDTGVAFAYSHNNHDFAQRIQQTASIFTAELYAILYSINYATTLHIQSLTIITDSRSAISAVVKYPSSNYLAAQIRCRIAELGYPVCLCWVPSHIGVPLNEHVDNLAKTAVTTAAIVDVPLPRSDIKLNIKRTVVTRWRNHWIGVNNNKYREVSNSVRSLPNSSSSNRQWEVTLCRLRLGHSTLTHSFLMCGGHLPYCTDCIVPLTIKHILTECPSYLDERIRNFGRGPHSIQSILSGTLAAAGGPVHKFLNDIGLLNSI